jgi:hypothetical protein
MDSGLLESASPAAFRGCCTSPRDSFGVVCSASGLRIDIRGLGGGGGGSATNSTVSFPVRGDMDWGGSADENKEELARPEKKSGPE